MGAEKVFKEHVSVICVDDEFMAPPIGCMRDSRVMAASQFLRTVHLFEADSCEVDMTDTSLIKSFRSLAAALAVALGVASAPVIHAAPVTVTGSSVNYAFDTDAWISRFGGRLSFAQVVASVSGNALTFDFGQNWGLQSTTTNSHSQAVNIEWFALPMQYTAAAGQKIDGYRLSITGTWSMLRDPSATSINQPSAVIAGLRTDGLIPANPQVASFEYASLSPGAQAGSFFQTALLSGSDAPLVSGELLAVATPGSAESDYAVGTASTYLRTLSIEVLTSPVPEPSTLLLLLSGLGALAVIGRRRQASSTR